VMCFLFWALLFGQ